MITFLDENDVEYGALATIKATNAVNGERSLTGTIASGDYVLSNIERGWRLRFDDEYFVVTYAKPIDEGRDVQVEFDAVHQFFWDFDKSSVYDQLTDGSHTFVAYLDFIFKNSGYSYTVDTALNVHAFEKQSFGFKKRLTLFNDIITSTGVEFQVNGKVVRILEKVGTDLSTVVRKNFNMNELTIEKNISDFVTYQKGFGAYFDEEDHSKGRLEVEYTSPLANVYGKLEAEPFVDERYSQSSSLLAVLKENVDNSYTISVALDMEDLTRAGYKYKQPVAGDYIMAINETLGFQEKIRIVSFTSEYDVQGILVKHEVTCNDIGSVKKLSASYTHTQHQAANAEVNANTAYEFANKALISADGKNTNYYGDTFPVDNPKGTLKKGDLLFLTVGDTVKQYYWNGADWIINPVLDDVEAFKEQIANELKDVPNREEFENKISEELATSKAEITTQIETAKTQAESNAKEYADTINQETAKVAELANAAADEIKADLVNVKNNLTSTSLVANNAQAAVDAAKQELTEVANELSTAKQDLTNSVAEVNTKVNSAKAELTQAKQDLISQAQQLQTQANAQTELSKRVTSVETTADGTKTTVNELTKTVAQNGKDITSVTARTKTVEDDLTSTKTTLSQVKTTADSTSQKTATLETGLNGLSAKFDNFKIGGANLLLYSADPSKAPSGYYDSNGTQRTSETYNGSVVYKTQGIWNGIRVNLGNLVDRGLLKVGDVLTYSAAIRAEQKTPIQARLFIRYTNQSAAESPTGQAEIVNLTAYWQYVSVTFTVTAKMLAANTKVTFLGWELTSNAETDKYVYYACNKVERGNVATDYSPNEADVEQKVAEYQASNDKMVASLKSSLQTIDGNVSNLQTKVEAVPGQITSAVSAVEGKIPTSSGGRNLAQGTSKDWSKPFTKFKGIENTTIGLYRVLTDGLSVGDKLKTRIVLKYTDIVPTSGQTAIIRLQGSGDVTGWKTGCYNFGAWKTISGSGEMVFEHEFKITADHLKNSYWSLVFRTDWIASGSLQWRLAKVERGMFFTDWSPAPEDTAEQISNLSSEIKQTADGITLLATKTELNTAKTELQSGITTATNKADTAQSTANNNAQTISTHTTQISALNTGLQAKVSQTDFNTLSGRVTTAENNITAKANELSSKISSVEGKIPTSIGGTNLLLYSVDPWKAPSDYYQFVGAVKTDETLNGSVVYKTHTIWNCLRSNFGKHLIDRANVKVGDEFTYSLYVRTDQEAPIETMLFFRYSDSSSQSMTGGKRITQQWQKLSVTFKVTEKMLSDSSKLSWVGFEQTSNSENGKFVYYACNKLERGNIATDWTPAPEDTASQISSLSSQIQQTADGMTLLATKTELNTAKSDLQSGINTATNKANAAQSTANSNAQTISTHTTQISALNSGLSAKVSQSDFNTLSGRVTTAENNITAKANELSSKITSVEGKIPTEIGTVNLFKGSRDFSGSNWIGGAGVYVEDYKGVKIFKKQDIWGGRSQYFEVKAGEEYVFSAYVKSSAKADRVNFYLPHESKQPMASGLVSFGSDNRQDNVNIGLTDKYQRIAVKIKITKDGWMAPRIERYNSDAYLFFGGYKLERGNAYTDWSPAPEDYDSKLASAQSEIKQTTDAIKASVSSLDSSTVKSSSLTINADGIVMKAGKSTTDVANAIGSYFSVNQNAINLFSDKINVKANMIVNGAITSDKIASKSINTAHLNGKIITADVISSNAVTANAIKAGAVTTDKMSANSINGDRIAAGTLDAAKIKAGSITASQIASGTITSNQIKAGGISSANIAAGAITTDKIAAGAIDANKIAANAITANMIRGGQLNSTNGATVFDLNAGTLTFNNNSGYIQRVASDKVFEITTLLGKDLDSREYLTSAFNIRKSDNSRRAGVKFTLYNTVEDKPTAEARMNADAFILADSADTRLFSVSSKSTFMGDFNMQEWGDIPIAKVQGGLLVKDIGIGGHMKSLLKIVEELCTKTGITWM